MKFRVIMALIALATVTPAAAASPNPAEQAEVQRLTVLLRSLHPRSGDVELPGADVILHLGKRYQFLPAAEAKRVLTEGWGNPPDAVADVLGMVFPAGKTFVDDTWGTVITFDPTGYVSDLDAKTADYGEILEQAQQGEDDQNRERSKRGFATAHLVGWAEQPRYEAATHSVIWARDIKFGNEADHTLNYDVRVLGRRGVLSLNTVATMSKLPEIRVAAAELGATASYRPGARYADYVPETDPKAEYGVAGLVAAGVGVAAAKKLGLLALLAVGGKKLIVVVIALGAAAVGWGRKLLGRAPAD